jgi:hypothetical protein
MGRAFVKFQSTRGSRSGLLTKRLMTLKQFSVGPSTEVATNAMIWISHGG